MTLVDVARWAVTALILGAASSVTTALVTQDAFPFGEWRDRRVARRPMRKAGAHVAEQIDDTDLDGNPVTVERPVPVFVGSRLSYLITCPRCAGIWSTGAWVAAYAVWSRGAIIAAACFAAAAVQRWLNAR